MKNKWMWMAVVVVMVLLPACGGFKNATKPDSPSAAGKADEDNARLATALADQSNQQVAPAADPALAQVQAELQKAKEEAEHLRNQLAERKQQFLPMPGMGQGPMAAPGANQGASAVLLADQSCLQVAYTETYPLSGSTEVRRIKSNVAWGYVNATSKLNGKPVMFAKPVVYGTGVIPTDACGNLQAARDPVSLGIQVMGNNGQPVVIQPERIMIGKAHGKPLYTWVYTITIAPYGAVDMVSGQQGALMVQYIVTDAGKLESVLLPNQVAYLEAWEGDMVTAEAFTTSTDPRTPARGKKRCAQEMVGRMQYLEVCG